MSKLWVYGDSFAVDYNDGKYEPSPWIEQVSNELNLEVVNYAWSGSSLDYTSVHIDETIHLWDTEDIVIVSLTEVLRTWTDAKVGNGFNKFSNMSDLEPVDFENGKIKLIARTNTAIRNNIIRVLDWKWLDVSTIVVLDGFQNKASSTIDIPENLIYTDKGYLMRISNGEPSGYYNLTTMGKDWRLNHLCKPNHEILAEKVLHSIISNENIDLTQGFKKNLFGFGGGKNGQI